MDRNALQRLLDEGVSLAEIGHAHGMHESTVRHSLRRYGLRTTNRSGRRMSDAARIGKEAGLPFVALDRYPEERVEQPGDSG